MIRKLTTFTRLDWRMKVNFAEAVLLPTAIWIGFKMLGVARTQGILRSWSGRPRRIGRIAEPGMATIARACRAQRIVKRSLGIDGSCLVRSLALWAMLRKRGIETELRVGMRKREGRVEGHAWLEFQGQALNEAESVIATYSALPVPVTYDLWLKTFRVGSKLRSLS
ncbi:MAG: lasso peptide biosynthesis B2 protein [Terriglobia bacterium]